MAPPQLHKLASKAFLIALLIFLVPVVVIPFGLYLAGVSIFPKSENTGATKAETGNLIRSEDGGDSWEFATRSEERDVSFPRVILDFVAHSQYPERILMGTQGAGLWKSSNMGKSWSRMADQSKTLSSTADIHRIAVSPSSPNIIYVAAYQEKRGRLFRSEDNGSTFQERYRTTADGFGVFDVAIDPSNADRVLIITGQGGLLESLNAGNTWRVRRWFSEALQRLIVNPLAPSNMFIITASSKILKSVDSGETWTEISITPGGAGTSVGLGIDYPPDVFGGGGWFGGAGKAASKALVLDPVNPSRLYLGSSDGLLRSDDGGLSWQRLTLLIPPEALPVTGVAVHPLNPDIIYAGAANQLHQSADGGAHWKVQNLATHFRVRRIFIHPAKPEVMFVIFGE